MNNLDNLDEYKGFDLEDIQFERKEAKYNDNLPGLVELISIVDEIQDINSINELDLFSKKVKDYAVMWLKAHETYVTEGAFNEDITTATDRLSRLYRIGGSIESILNGLKDKAVAIYHSESKSLTHNGKPLPQAAVAIFIEGKVATLKSYEKMIDYIIKDLAGRTFAYRNSSKKSYV